MCLCNALASFLRHRYDKGCSGRYVSSERRTGDPRRTTKRRTQLTLPIIISATRRSTSERLVQPCTLEPTPDLIRRLLGRPPALSMYRAWRKHRCGTVEDAHQIAATVILERRRFCDDRAPLTYLAGYLAAAFMGEIRSARRYTIAKSYRTDATPRPEQDPFDLIPEPDRELLRDYCYAKITKPRKVERVAPDIAELRDKYTMSRYQLGRAVREALQRAKPHVEDCVGV